MANEKRVWTNADVKRHERTTLPAGDPRLTQEGPWTRSPEAMAALDAIVNEGFDGSADDVLRGARETLKRTQPFQAAMNDVDRQMAEPGQAAAQSRAASMPRAFVEGVRQSPTAQGAMIAGSLIPTPAQPAFAGLLALDQAARVYEDPSVAGAAMAGASLIPGAGAALRMGRGAKAAKDGKQVAEGMFRATGLRRSQEVPYRAGPSAGSRYNTEPYRPSGYARERDALSPNASITQRVDDVPVPQRSGMGRGPDPDAEAAIAGMDDLLQGVPTGRAAQSAEEVYANFDSGMPAGPLAILDRLSRDMRTRAAGPQVQRVPMGRTGSEFAGVPVNNMRRPILDPEEAGVAEEFTDAKWADIWDAIIAASGR